jgi:Arginase family
VNSVVTLLNFDGAYNGQSFYRESPYHWIDFDWMRNVSLYCEKSNFSKIVDKLTDYPGGIYYLGSGNYHYVSYLLQSKVKQPYTLVLFDHHTDTLPTPSENLLSCGSWVLESLKTLPLLKKVYILGVGEEAYRHIPRDYDDKIVFYTEESLQSNLSSILESVKRNIPTTSVYLSIDKDVLDKRDALTGWDHGTLRLNQLMKLLMGFTACKEVVGVDICGEYPVNPAKEFLQETKRAIEKNNNANGFILKHLHELVIGRARTTLLHA